MARADLLALTPAGLTQISNAGLVKRSQRDLDSGQVPDINETDDGTIEARFSDGTLARLAAGRTPTDATCSCPASQMCRHRVMLVLAYQRLHVAPERAESWDPALLDLAGYESTLTAGALAELKRLLSAPLPVALERGPVPAARLPMATVHFLAPNNLAYARCDCAEMTGCVHVALAVQAFRAAKGAAETTLGAAMPTKAADKLVPAVHAVLAQLLREGIVAGMAAHAARLDHACNVARTHGATWLVLAIEALVEQVEAYERRSARYDELTALSLAAELYARTRSANSVAALGIGEALETTMAKTRLVSLGVRISARGNELVAAALLADSDTGTPLLLENRFTGAKDGIRLTVETVGERLLAPGVSVRAAGRGQILTSVAKRRADGLLVLGQSAGGKTVLLPQASLPPLPAPLATDNLLELNASSDDRPPALIAPRNRVLDMHVFTIDSVIGQAFVSGAQMWRAAVSLPNNGGTLHLERRYDAGAPSALPTLFAAFDGRYGIIQRIAGTVHRKAGEIVCEPWSLAADRFIVPDLEQTDSGTDVAMVEGSNDSLAPAELARRFLAGTVHAGSRQRNSQFDDRGREMLANLRQAGFEQTTQVIAAWLASPPDNIVAFGEAAVWLDTLLAG